MFFIFGLRRFGLKKVGYGKDFCNSCENEAIINRFQWFTWCHIFFIPLIPLGYHSKFNCTICGNNPHAMKNTPLWLRILFIFILLCIGSTTITSGLYRHFSFGWIIKTLITFAITAACYWVFRKLNQATFKEQRSKITPVNQQVCVLCDGEIVQKKQPTCSRCKLEVY